MEITLIRFIACSLIIITLSTTATLLLLGMRHILNDEQTDRIICSANAAAILCVIVLIPEAAGLQHAAPALAKVVGNIADTRTILAVLAAETATGFASGWWIFTLMVPERRKRRRLLSLNEETMTPNEPK